MRVSHQYPLTGLHRRPVVPAALMIMSRSVQSAHSVQRYDFDSIAKPLTIALLVQ